MRKYFLLILLFSFLAVEAQFRVFTKNYSVESGLSQNTVTDMVKDSSGFVWFTTRDGLSRFDGYDFINFKASSKLLQRSISNQFYSIEKDAADCFWITNDIGQVFRFNPTSEEFVLYPSAESNKGDNYFSVRELIKISEHEFWLIGYANGCMRAMIDSLGDVNLSAFCQKNSSTKTGFKVNSVLNDRDDKKWILTDRGIAIVAAFDTLVSTTYLTDSSLTVNSYSAVETNDEMLIGCSQGRLYRYDKIKKRFSLFEFSTHADLIHVFQLDNNHALVITNSREIYIFDIRDNSYKTTQLSLLSIENAWQDVSGDVWIKDLNGSNYFCFNRSDFTITPYNFRYSGETFASFSKFHQKSDKWLSFIDDRNSMWLLPDNHISKWYYNNYQKEKPYFENKTEQSRNFPMVLQASYKDTLGVYWVSNNSGGVQKCVSLNNSFHFWQCINSLEYTEKNDVLSVFEDSYRRLWVATQDGCIRLYDEKGMLTGFLNRQGAVTKIETSFGDALSIYQDRNGIMWIGSYKGLYQLLPKTKDQFEVKTFIAEEKEYAPLSVIIRDILEDSRGRIWLATDGGGLHLVETDNNKVRFIHRENGLKYNYPPIVEQSRCLYEDQNGNIWLGSSEGITVFSSEFGKPEEIRFFFYNTENTNLTNSCIYDILQDKNGMMWFASFGGGLFKTNKEFFLFETPEFISYSKQNKKFPSDLVLGMQEDEYGILWVVTEESIVKFDAQKQLAEPFGKIRGLEQASFSERSIIRRKSGEFVVGSGSGLYSFNPKTISHSEYCPRIVWTRFMLYNKEVQIGEENSILDKSINYMSEIRLNHDQSVFTIEYSALDYRHSEHLQYAYKLDNFETEWNYVGNQRVASYTNLPKGTYYFRVRSTNSEGVWFDNDRVLKITVLPSFWETGWAYLLYVLLFLIVVFIIFAIYRMRTKMALDQEMSASKLQFFTDVSHELRTPLTLINAPLENVLENGQLNVKDREQLEVVHTNANRMLRMMNQILDFRKIQSNKMRLKVEKTKLGEFVSACSSNFLKLAENRQVQFSIEDNTKDATFWIDRDKIDTVMFNLLSNAFKFTPSGKSVKVTIWVENGNGMISVSDEGCGIPKDKLSVIFERYITLQTYSLTKQSGTGIGLSLVKEIVEMHKASISVKSEESVGSCFEICFQPGISHFDETTDIVVNDEKNTVTEETKATPKEVHESNGLPSLLIVEDNDQLREFLISVLSKKFTIFEASNGKMGYETVVREMPDFIITDIMMPIMDGIEMTRKIRSNEQVSHIPIILLTAKTDMQSKIECLRIGANDYITKPFNMNYLETRVENILEERRKWQEMYKNELLRSTPKPEPVTTDTTEKIIEENLETKDDLFMKQLVECIEKNMENTNFSMDDIQEMLKISRWHLISKVKSLVGLTPNELIRETRLSQAAKLIDDGEYNMTQITYMIGMTDSRYFSRCFKQKYGMTPTEYKLRKKE